MKLNLNFHHFNTLLLLQKRSKVQPPPPGVLSPSPSAEPTVPPQLLSQRMVFPDPLNFSETVEFFTFV